MPSFLFWIFAIVMLVFGAAVVINRNPIASALSLVVCFLGLSALFMSLDAFFIGIIQVLVYAGAVMVLFLFIIMLLDLRAEERRKLNWIAFGGGFLVAFSRFRLGDDGLPNYNAQVLVFFIITVAAAEVAVGLAIIVALYRARRTTHVEDINSLKF